MTSSTTGPNPPPTIFLFGPPGVGKSTLGFRACEAFGLRFVDLGSLLESLGGEDSAEFGAVFRGVDADVVEIPWELQSGRQLLALVRQVGVSLLLWAHPEDMQLRSGRDERLLTPVGRLTLRGGFGRQGTGCREFRRLDRACEETLLLVDLDLEEAAEDVKDCIAAIREERSGPASPTEQEGLAGWVVDWSHDYEVSRQVVEVIVDGMARYLVHLRASGASPRTLSSVSSDLNAAGQLCLMYDPPKGDSVLGCFDGWSWESEFRRKFSDRPTAVSRYRRNLRAFSDFLRASGALPGDEESAAGNCGGQHRAVQRSTHQVCRAAVEQAGQVAGSETMAGETEPCTQEARKDRKP